MPKEEKDRAECEAWLNYLLTKYDSDEAEAVALAELKRDKRVTVIPYNSRDFDDL